MEIWEISCFSLFHIELNWKSLCSDRTRQDVDDIKRQINQLIWKINVGLMISFNVYMLRLSRQSMFSIFSIFPEFKNISIEVFQDKTIIFCQLNSLQTQTKLRLSVSYVCSYKTTRSPRLFKHWTRQQSCCWIVGRVHPLGSMNISRRNQPWEYFWIIPALLHSCEPASLWQAETDSKLQFNSLILTDSLALKRRCRQHQNKFPSESEPALRLLILIRHLIANLCVIRLKRRHSARELQSSFHLVSPLITGW